MTESEVVFTCPKNYQAFPFHVSPQDYKLHPNKTIIFKAAKFVKILNPEKVRGYSVSMRYLVGRETTVISWDQNLVQCNDCMTVTLYVVFQGYFSIVGLSIHLQSIGRSRKETKNSERNMILGKTFMFTSCRPRCSRRPPWPPSCCRLHPIPPAPRFWSPSSSARLAS